MERRLARGSLHREGLRLELGAVWLPNLNREVVKLPITYLEVETND